MDYQVPITESEKGNAIYGLLRWCNWEPVSEGSNQVTMGIRLYPQPGYPLVLDATVDYRLDDEGLTVTDHGDQSRRAGLSLRLRPLSLPVTGERID